MRRRLGFRPWTYAFVLLATCAVAIEALAMPSKFWFHVGAVSYHPDRDKHYNERNATVGIEYRFHRKHAVSAGQYKNSYFNRSNYLYYTWTPIEVYGVNLGVTRVPSVRFGILAGTVDGYRRNGGRLAPVALPLAILEWRHVGINLTGFPNIGDVDGGIALQLKVSF